jgi:5'-nucleotidase
MFLSSLRKGDSSMERFAALRCLCFFLVLSGCIAKKPAERSLLRAVQLSDTEPTCARLLPASEYKELMAQLKPTDPLVVVSTNDLHGRTDEKSVDLKVSDLESHSVKVGGLERLAMYLSALCRNAKGRLLYLDAGDSYQGSVLSNSTFGEAVVESFSELGLVASTFGNHEFDFGQDQIRSWLSNPKRSFWYVTSSLQSAAGGKSTPWAELNAPRFARSVVLDVAGVKVGIAGYTTETTGAKSLPENVSNIQFQKLKKVLLEEGEPLREQGAQVTILLSHAGGKCDMRQAAPLGDQACRASVHDELYRALIEHREVAVKWNLVVAGHSHSPQRHIISGVPVIQTSGLGQSITHARLTLSGKSVSTELLDPTYLCEAHFENWSGCHPEEWDWKKERPKALGRPVPVKVFGQSLNTVDGIRVRRVLDPYRNRLQQQMSKRLAEFRSELPHNRLMKSPAAACLVDAWFYDLKHSDEHWDKFHSSQIDAAFLNSGALRDGISPGALTWGKLFEIIPFDNTAHIVELSTEELTRFARAHEESPHDYLLASEGWVVKRRGNDATAPRTTMVSPLRQGAVSKPKWLVAVSTFSKTFLERAGIAASVFDTGFSVRGSIARVLEQKMGSIASCNQPNETRMEY